MNHIYYFPGAVFESSAKTEKSAFEFGIEQVNRDNAVLRNITLISVSENVNDVFMTSKKG